MHEEPTSERSPVDPPARPHADDLMTAIRFGRPDGSEVFGPRLRSAARLAGWRARADQSGDPGARAVLDRWLPAPGPGDDDADPAPLPLPALSWDDPPRAVLRPDWTLAGDLVAVDHPARGDLSRVEVAGRGRTWIGSHWTTDPAPARFGRARRVAWASGPFADGFEWTYRTDRGRVTRTAVLLRGRGLALLAEQRTGDLARDPAPLRFDLPAGLAAVRLGDSPVLALSAGRGRPAARAFALDDAPPDRPAPGPRLLDASGSSLTLRPAPGGGKRAWLALVVSWGKPPSTWRALTVTDKSRICRPGLAVGYRIGWGPRDESVLIYRSLGPASIRAVLGHQTPARFLVGAFGRTGDVRPWLRFDRPAAADPRGPA